MGIFNNKVAILDDETPVVEEFESTEEAVTAHDEQVISTDTVDEPITTGTFVENPFQKEGETTQEYNERVPVAVQPVAEAPTTSYLGEPL